MKIQSINTLTPIKNNNLKKNTTTPQSAGKSTNMPEKVDYSAIPFCAIHNIKPHKLLNIDLERKKLIKLLNEILETQPVDYNLEDLVLKAMRDSVTFLRNKALRMKELHAKLEELAENTMLNPRQQISRLHELKKEFNRLDKSRPPKLQPPKPTDERIDYKLINKFKTAIAEDNFRLDKVYSEYYKELENISAIKELTKKYPKIKIPQRPEDVIAKKIEATFTRDFYEEFDDLCKTDKSKVFQFSDKKVSALIDDIAKKYNLDSDKLYAKIAKPVHMLILDKYKLAKEEGFSIFPPSRKTTIPQISDIDIKLLQVNFKDFVLSTVKKQYLQSQKPGEIIYQDKNGITIPIRSLSNSEYKFGKVSEKTLSLIKSAEKIKQSQRSYEFFDFPKLKERLNYYAGTELGNDDKLFEHILNFDACAEADNKNLIRFLQELDIIRDGDKTIKASLSTIEKEGIKPHETERINEQERKEAAQRFKLEQQRVMKLNQIKTDFDNVIDILYQNDMTDIANTCSKYRPESLETGLLNDAKFLIKLINENADNTKQVNKIKLNSQITNWDNYKYYLKHDPEGEIFLKAIKYGTDANGKLDINKAGQYITNSEIINSYPDSVNFVSYPELLTKIMAKNTAGKEEITEALCRYSDYIEDDKNKTFLVKLLENFDTKNQTDKLILKHILENDYAKTPTKVFVNMPEGNQEKVEAAITPDAKQAIIEKYKYPNCLEYLEAFENALPNLARAKGASGIKLMGRNNDAMEYRMELKINGHDDRLFSSGNDFCFDVFSPRGLH